MQLLAAKIVKMYIPFGSRGLYGSEVLKQVKKFNMDEQALKEFIYGGTRELMKNRKYYYHSSVSSEYCKWTDEGAKALADFMNLIGHQMIVNEEAALNKRAKELVLKGLKGEQV
jgi:hypothetical protein